MPQILPRLLVAAIIGFVWEMGVASVALAEPPRINAISPSGVCRGVTTEVVISGTNLGGTPRWLGSFDAEASANPQADPNAWKVRITPSVDVPVGVYLVRVQTEGGLSNPFLFAVDQVPHIGEAEDNSVFASAQKIETPTVVEGQASGTDVDFFRFSGRKGERIVIDAMCARVGSGVDPSLRLSTLGRRFVASADDTPGLITDARLFAELPVDGDYVVELSDARYQGAGPRTNYRLLIGAVPAAETIFPLGGRRGETVRFELAGGTLIGSIPHLADLCLTPDLAAEPGHFRPRITEAILGTNPVATGGWWLRDIQGLPPLAWSDYPEYREPTDPAAPPIRASIPAVFNGRIEAPGDSDSFVVFGVSPGQKLRVAAEAVPLGSELDGVLQVRGVNGAVLANDDDSAIPARAKPAPSAPANPRKPPILSLDPEVSVTVPAGTTEITVSLRDLGGNGGMRFPYRLTVEPTPPGFSILAGTQDQVNIPRGGTAGISVEVERRDLAGPITLNVADPPSGLSVRPGLIPPGQTVGSLSVSTAPGVSFDRTTLRVVGEAVGPSGPIVAEATRTTILAQQADFATEVITAEGLVSALASPSPVNFDSPTAPVEVVPGDFVSIPVRASRSTGAEDVVLTFGSLPTIPDLAVAPNSKLAAKALEGAISLRTTANLAPGPVVVVFTAKGKFGDQERTVAIPAVTLDVVHPVTAGSNSPKLEVFAGASSDARGKVLRRGAFRQPVTVKLDGLPAGLKAEPVIVPPEATDFVLKVIADPKAAPVEAQAKLTVAFQVNKKDYPTPPTPLLIKVVPSP